jgi:hypothetical protein
MCSTIQNHLTARTPQLFSIPQTVMVGGGKLQVPSHWMLLFVAKSPSKQRRQQ